MGSFGLESAYKVFWGFYVFYYVDVLGLAVTLAALINVVYGIWDAVNDPLVGYLSDNTRTRWGRRRPWLLAGLPLYVGFLVLTYAVPGSLREGLPLFWYALAMVMLFETASTVMSVNYDALFPELFRGVRVRARASSIYQGFCMSGELVGFALTPIVYTRFGFVGMALLFAAITGVTLTIGVVGHSEDPRAREAPRSRLRAVCTDVLRDRLTLLATKLRIPRPHRALVHRPRLVARLEEGLRGKLTLVSAPAGYGKTTLVSEWVASHRRGGPRLEHGGTDDGPRGRGASVIPPEGASTAVPRPRGQASLPLRVAWLSLDPSDNDLARFLSYLIAALQAATPQIDPAVGAEIQPILESGEELAIERLLTALLNDVVASDAHLALVLDDYHVILLRDFLQRRLRSTQPALVPELYLRASQWYERQGRVDDAIEHAPVGEDATRAARLLDENAEAYVFDAQVSKLIRLANRLPEGERRRFPRLCIYYAWALQFEYQLEAAESALRLPAARAASSMPHRTRSPTRSPSASRKGTCAPSSITARRWQTSCGRRWAMGLQSTMWAGYWPRWKTRRRTNDGNRGFVVRRPSSALPEPLNDREMQVLRLLAAGLSDRQIAEELYLSVNTVKWYNRQIYSKLAVGRRGQAVARAQELGLL